MNRFINSVSHDIEMMKFLYDRTGCDLRGQNLDGPRWFCVTARDRYDGQLGGVLACEFTSPFEAHFTVAIDDPEVINRPLLHNIFSALFSRAVRITAHVEPHDSHAEALVQRLGFVYEGFLRRGYDGDRDALIYGMLKQDCKYLPGVRAARRINGGTHDETALGARSVSDVGSTAERQRRERSGIRYN
jgi:hypothetical protein